MIPDLIFFFVLHMLRIIFPQPLLIGNLKLLKFDIGLNCMWILKANHIIAIFVGFALKFSMTLMKTI